MGGNALKIQTERLQADDYHKLAAEVVGMLRASGYVKRAEAMINYSTKSDFGDLDVLVTRSDEYSITRMLELFQPKDHFKNGTILSLEYKNFQVDLVSISEESFDYAFNYFYGELGNLIGRLAHKIGLKHGHEGLQMILKDGDYQFATLMLTSNHDDTLRLLGLDVERYHQKFETLDQMFEWIAGSKLFSPAIYLLENRNAIAKQRDRKRKVYQAFLAWCAERYDITAPIIKKDKSDYLPMIFEAFPHAERWSAEQIELLRIQRIIKSKMNGAIVMELTGLSGKHLGELMAFVKTKIDKNYILETDQPAINQRIIECAKEFIKNR